PISLSEVEGSTAPVTASGPADVPPAYRKSPPRSNAPGAPLSYAPTSPCASPVALTPGLQAPPPVDRGTQSATHSKRLPTMSKAPRDDTQLARDPVRATASVLAVLQSVEPLSGPGSGVPATSPCHSGPGGRRLPQ